MIGAQIASMLELQRQFLEKGVPTALITMEEYNALRKDKTV
jgi:cellobiose-specific phosphotransferase system component IIB